MMKPFDLEAAKRGEPIQYYDGSKWVPAHFVGIARTGGPVVQWGFGYTQPLDVQSKDVRMFSTCERVEAIALKSGFRLEKQEDGSMSINPYLYNFAHALMEDQS